MICVVLISLSEGGEHGAVEVLDITGISNMTTLDVVTPVVDPAAVTAPVVAVVEEIVAAVNGTLPVVDGDEEAFNMDKLAAILFALGTGVVFSINSIEMHYSAKTQNIGATQMNIDGNFILGVIVLPFYIYEMSIVGGHTYTAVDLILANTNIVCIIIASTGLTAAMAVGQAGPVQAIEMMKTVW